MPGLAVRRDDGAYVIPGFLRVRGDSVLQALPRPGQVALARAVRVQGLAVKDQPDARLRLGPEDQQAVFRLAGIIDRLPDDAAFDLTQINARGRLPAAHQYQESSRHPQRFHCTILLAHSNASVLRESEATGVTSPKRQRTGDSCNRRRRANPPRRHHITAPARYSADIRATPGST